MASKGCSSRRSELVKLFLERSGVHRADPSPEKIMIALVNKMARRASQSQEQRLHRALSHRNIKSVDFCDNLGCDGILEPCGSTFTEGFRIQLKRGVTGARMRFTMAHEVCHTFFYELVPELKFRPHERDDWEETLCNLGAATLLIPDRRLRSDARELPICLDSLQRLAENYRVSLPTMLLRLNALGLWKCELSTWHRKVDDSFILDRLYGGRQASWEWQDESVLNRAWESAASIFGKGYVYLTDSAGSRRYKPIRFDIRRYGPAVIALCGNTVKPNTPDYPLLKSSGSLRRMRGIDEPSNSGLSR